MERYTFKSFDGKELSVVEWKPQGEIKAIIQISHGMGEHAMRYDDFATRLNSEGYLVFADDHRAHGETDKDNLGYAKGDIFSDTVKDLILLTEKYKKEYEGKFFVLFGHSYGSFLTQRYMEKSNLYDAVILSGSSYMLKPLSFSGMLIAHNRCVIRGPKKPCNILKKITFDSYNKNFNVGSFVSSLPEEVAKYEGDKYCNYVLSNNFYRHFMKGLVKLHKDKGNSNVDKDKPLLIISGDKDPVGDFGKGVIRLDKFYKKIGVKSVKTVLLEDSRHECHHDIKREDFYKTVIGFIEENRK